MSACATFDDLTLGYNSHPAVHHLNGVVTRGSLTAVVGANRSGKSTLMKGIVGVLTVCGLLLSYHASLPSGPAIILSAGMAYFASVVAGSLGVLLTRRPRMAHRTA